MWLHISVSSLIPDSGSQVLESISVVQNTRWKPTLDRTPSQYRGTSTHTHSHSIYDNPEMPRNLMCTSLGVPEENTETRGNVQKLHSNVGQELITFSQCRKKITKQCYSSTYYKAYIKLYSMAKFLLSNSKLNIQKIFCVKIHTYIHENPKALQM